MSQPEPADYEAAQLARVKELSFYQKIDLPDGTTTSGCVDHRSDPATLGLDDGVVRGRTLLDIAANDGFWSFWAEKQGASQVLAIDVEKYEDYDWGRGGVPAELRGKAAKHENFDQLYELFGSKVERKHLSVYDLDPKTHGTYDISVCYGLIYHLRHPLLAIDRVRACTTGMGVFNTHTFLARRELPYTVFFLDDVFGSSITNWTGASESCVVHWMKDAGFDEVFVERQENPRQESQVFSKIYVGCITADHTERMHGNPRFRHCDEEYFRRSRVACEQAASATLFEGEIVTAAMREELERAVRTEVNETVAAAVNKALQEQAAESRKAMERAVRRAISDVAVEMRSPAYRAYRKVRKRVKDMTKGLSGS